MFSFKKTQDGKAPQVDEIDDGFQPRMGSFFRTLEFPLTDLEGNTTGKIWFEAGLDAKSGKWVLWQKSIKNMEDLLLGGTVNTLTATVIFEKTSFIEAYKQMTTFEKSQLAQAKTALETKTVAKLGGDYYRQFAWREGLMMSRSGRLYPMSDDAQVVGDNYFDQKDIDDRKVFMERLKTEKFIPVPIELPSVDWKKAYAANKEKTDSRLNLLKARYGGDFKNNYELALQVIGQEQPEVLYALLNTGFSPKVFQDTPAQHFALVQAAVDRPNVEVLNLLSEAGMSFTVRQNGKTPLEAVLDQRRYSHLHVMIQRDGAKIVNYADENGTLPAMVAIVHQDMQAFRMLYLEGLAYDKVDENGWAIVHYAFANSFLPGVYAWIDEGLSIDTPIKGSDLTGLSIARRQNDQPLIDFALKNGANPDAPVFAVPVDEPKKSEPSTTPVTVDAEFSLDILNSASTNKEITQVAEAFVKAGGDLNVLSSKGLSVFEMCWKNQKPKPELDRRALIPVFTKLGVDASALLSDGTTTLNRAAKNTAAFDAKFFQAVAPSVKDPNTGDADGNNVVHILQMNSSEVVSHSNNVAALMKLFPTLDINRQNNEGYSNVGLAIRLNRSQTLKNFAATSVIDWAQVTKAGWTYLDIAFTAGPWKQKVAGLPQRVEKMTGGSDAMRTAVLDLFERTIQNATPEAKASLLETIDRERPDGKRLPSAMSDEKAPEALLSRLVQACPSAGPQKKALPKQQEPKL